jgi:molybdenum cofactor guanylyltransferase
MRYKSSNNGGKKNLLSAVVLAGGKSRRMGSDKAFLKLGDRTFLSIITSELMKVSDDIIVVVGKEEPQKFNEVIDRSIKVIRDRHDFGSPASGIATCLEHTKYLTATIVACDLPLVKAEVIDYLYMCSPGYSAAVPIWPNGDIEPLCAVYNIRETKAALAQALEFNHSIGPRHIIRAMKNVNYVRVSSLRSYDRALLSLFNVNSRDQYLALLDKITHSREKNPNRSKER